MRIRRRVILQMTPLLDLLLVVIFAQYMDLQTVSRRMLRQEQVRSWQARTASVAMLRRERQSRRDAQSLREEALRQLEDVKDRLGPLVEAKKTLQARGEQLAKRNAALETEVRALRKENAQLLAKVDEDEAKRRAALEAAREAARRKAERKAQQDIQEIGGIFREMLNVDDKYIRSALAGRSVREIAAIADEFQKLKESKKAAAIVRHLRKAAEFRKRCDFWEFHISADDSVRIKIRGKVVEPKLFFRNADDFATQVFDLVQRQEDPKDMVLILYSYGNARWAARRAVRAGLANLVKLLDAKWKRSRRLHVSNLGYSAEAP